MGVGDEDWFLLGVTTGVGTDLLVVFSVIGVVSGAFCRSVELTGLTDSSLLMI